MTCESCGAERAVLLVLRAEPARDGRPAKPEMRMCGRCHSDSGGPARLRDVKPRRAVAR